MKDSPKFNFDLQLFAEEDDDASKNNQEGGQESQESETKSEDRNYDDLDKIKKTLESDEISSELLKKIVNDLIEDNKKYRNLAGERLREVMSKKEKLKKIEEEQEKARIETLKKKEEYKKLAEEMEPKLKALTDDVAQTQAFFEELLSQKLQQVPDEYKDLVPEEVDIRKKIKWIDNFLVKMSKQQGQSSQQPQTPANVNLGQTGPKESGTTKPNESKIREELLSAKSVQEFEEILKKYGRRI